MEYIDRYLQSVKSALPKRQQDDVVRELTDEVLSRVEEKEEALGRPLTEDEQVALLKQLGHPWLLASRYRKHRYLIDPSLFAIYWIVLRLLLVFTFVGMSVGAIAAAATGQGLGQALRILIRYPWTALWIFGWVTLVFVVLDVVQAKVDFFGKWDPRTLPKVSKSKRPRMSETIACMFFGAIFGVWWLVGLKNQFWIFGPAAAYLRFGPVFQTVFPLYALMVFADVTRHAMTLMRPAWERGRVAFRLFFRLTNLTILYFLVNAPDLLVPANAADAKAQAALKGVNQGIHTGLVVVTVIVAIQFLWDVYTVLFRNSENGERAVASL